MSTPPSRLIDRLMSQVFNLNLNYHKLTGNKCKKEEVVREFEPMTVDMAKYTRHVDVIDSVFPAGVVRLLTYGRPFRWWRGRANSYRSSRTFFQPPRKKGSAAYWTGYTIFQTLLSGAGCSWQDEVLVFFFYSVTLHSPLVRNRYYVSKQAGRENVGGRVFQQPTLGSNPGKSDESLSIFYYLNVILASLGAKLKKKKVIDFDGKHPEDFTWDRRTIQV